MKKRLICLLLCLLVIISSLSTVYIVSAEEIYYDSSYSITKSEYQYLKDTYQYIFEQYSINESINNVKAYDTKLRQWYMVNNGDNLYINREYFSNSDDKKKRLVYGNPGMVRNNDYKSGQYRYLGFTEDGTPYPNQNFPNDFIATWKPKDKVWQYRPWNTEEIKYGYGDVPPSTSGYGQPFDITPIEGENWFSKGYWINSSGVKCTIGGGDFGIYGNANYMSFKSRPSPFNTGVANMDKYEQNMWTYITVYWDPLFLFTPSPVFGGDFYVTDQTGTPITTIKSNEADKVYIKDNTWADLQIKADGTMLADMDKTYDSYSSVLTAAMVSKVASKVNGTDINKGDILVVKLSYYHHSNMLLYELTKSTSPNSVISAKYTFINPFKDGSNILTGISKILREEYLKPFVITGFSDLDPGNSDITFKLELYQGNVIGYDPSAAKYKSFYNYYQAFKNPKVYNAGEKKLTITYQPVEPVPALIMSQSKDQYGYKRGDGIQDGDVIKLPKGQSLMADCIDVSTADDGLFRILKVVDTLTNKPVLQQQDTKKITAPVTLQKGSYQAYITILKNGKQYKSNVIGLNVVEVESPTKPLPVPVISTKNGTVKDITLNQGEDGKITGAPSYDPLGRKIVKWIWFLNGKKVITTKPELDMNNYDNLPSGSYILELGVIVLDPDEGEYPVDVRVEILAKLNLVHKSTLMQYPVPKIRSTTHTEKSKDGYKYIEVVKDTSFTLTGDMSTSPNGAIKSYTWRYRKGNAGKTESGWSAEKTLDIPVYPGHTFYEDGDYIFQLKVCDAAGVTSGWSGDYHVVVGSLPGNAPTIIADVPSKVYINNEVVLHDKSYDVDELTDSGITNPGKADSFLSRATWAIIPKKYEAFAGLYSYFVDTKPTQRTQFGWKTSNGIFADYRDKFAWTVDQELTKHYFNDFPEGSNYWDSLGGKSNAWNWDATMTYQKFEDGSNITEVIFAKEDPSHPDKPIIMQISDQNDRKVSVKFLATGTYTAFLWISDEEGNIVSKTYDIEVVKNEPPLADFATSGSAGRKAPTPVFDYSQDADDGIKYYTWFVEHNGAASSIKIDADNNSVISNNIDPLTKADLNGLKAGDGNMVYNDLGTYRVWLKVADHIGQESTSKTITVTVTNAKPVCSISADTVTYVGEFLNSNLAATDYDGTIKSETVTVNGTPLSSADTAKLKNKTYYFTEEGIKNFFYAVTDNDDATSSPAGAMTIVKVPKPTACWTIVNQESTLKENRQIVLDGSMSQNMSEAVDKYPLDWSKAEWTVEPVSGVTAAQIKTKKLGDGSKLGILIKGSGEIRVGIRVKNSNVKNMPDTGYYSDWYYANMAIAPDAPPVSDFVIKTPVVYRAPQNNNTAGIVLEFTGCSRDNDSISSLDWYVQYDNNDNKAFDEGWTLFHSGSEKAVVLNTSKVGLYRFKVAAKEEFGQPTIAEFVTGADRKASDSSWRLPVTGSYSESTDLGITVAVVDNVAPKSSLEVIKNAQADILIIAEPGYWNQLEAEDASGKDYVDKLLEKLKISDVDADIKIVSFDPNVAEQQRTNK